MSPFEIKLAAEQKDVESAQRLRFEVFNLEMHKGLKSSYQIGLDRDEYDPLCDHLLIIDKDKEQTIGTYRLLLSSRLGKSAHFYSENEFDLTNIRKLKGEVMEMGRSCVHKDYRRNAILSLLWAGIVAYMKEYDVKYVIGCPSLYTSDKDEINKIYSVLKRSYFSPQMFRVTPQKGRAVASLDGAVRVDGDEKKILLKLPALVRSYLKIGAIVCGEPAVDREFDTVDLFMLLDVAKMSDGYLKRMTKSP